MKPADEGVAAVSGDMNGAGHLVERDAPERPEALEAGSGKRPEELVEDGAIRWGGVRGAEDRGQAGSGRAVGNARHVEAEEVPKVVVSSCTGGCGLAARFGGTSRPSGWLADDLDLGRGNGAAERQRPTEAVSGRFRGASGKLRAAGSPLTNDLDLPRGTGRVENGRGGGHRPCRKSVPSVGSHRGSGGRRCPRRAEG